MSEEEIEAPAPTSSRLRKQSQRVADANPVKGARTERKSDRPVVAGPSSALDKVSGEPKVLGDNEPEGRKGNRESSNPFDRVTKNAPPGEAFDDEWLEFIWPDNIILGEE
jgi:hypothetical protein